MCGEVMVGMLVVKMCGLVRKTSKKTHLLKSPSKLLFRRALKELLLLFILLFVHSRKELLLFLL